MTSGLIGRILRRFFYILQEWEPQAFFRFWLQKSTELLVLASSGHLQRKLKATCFFHLAQQENRLNTTGTESWTVRHLSLWRTGNKLDIAWQSILQWSKTCLNAWTSWTCVKCIFWDPFCCAVILDRSLMRQWRLGMWRYMILSYI